jgi:hypothetical protein
MLIRALLVLLVALNLGAAAWWISRRPPQSLALPAQPVGVPRLQLLSEHRAPGAIASPAPAPPVAPLSPSESTPPAATVAAVPKQCFSVGPFTDEVAAGAAARRIGVQATHVRPRQVPGTQANGYNVFLPPSPDRAAAQALAPRIGAAGFDDYLVVSSGDQANGIALGRYRSREGAERRRSALEAAGFAAQLQAIGDEGPKQWWLDVTAADGVAGSKLKDLAVARQSRSFDCAELR